MMATFMDIQTPELKLEEIHNMFHGNVNDEPQNTNVLVYVTYIFSRSWAYKACEDIFLSFISEPHQGLKVLKT